MLILSPLLTVLAVVMIGVLLLVTKKIGGNSGKFFVRQQIALADVTGYVEERMNGQRVVKVFNHENKSKEEFDKLNEQLFESAANANAFANMMGPVIGNIGNLQFVLTAVLGGFLSVQGVGGITLGVMASYLQFTKSFTQPFMQVAQQFMTHTGGNFSSNVYTHVNHDSLNGHLFRQMACIRTYPERNLIPWSASWQPVIRYTPENVCVTNGATEAIYLIAQAWRGSRSAILMPTFSEYADACRLHAHEVESVFTLDALSGRTSLVWLCNPNNPTGEVRPADRLRRLIEEHPRQLFVIDQSYEGLYPQGSSGG